MKLLKKVSSWVVLVAMGSLLVGCGNHNNNNEEPNLAKNVKVGFKLEFIENHLTENQNKLFDMEVSYRMPNGELKTNPITIPCVIEEDTTFVLEPSAIDITITEKLKDDVVLTEESYLAGWEYLLYVYVGDEKGGTFSCIRDTTFEEYDYQSSEIPVGYIDQNHQRFNIGVNGNIYR
ncbi:MAG: hypothetical protein UFP03_04780 [Paludibacteraceae bacterium]|nr:hypothetical protein [Paludibacteraceae bacterium]